MSTVLTAEKMHIQDAPRRLRFWRPDAAAKTFTLPAWASAGWDWRTTPRWFLETTSCEH